MRNGYHIYGRQQARKLPTPRTGIKHKVFSRGPMTHGSKNHREPGSIGQGSTPGRVHKGKKMGGRLGGKKTTIKNLEVIYINSKDNLLVVRGSVPGKSGNLLSIR